MTENKFGPDHQNTAQSLNNLALLYQDMGDYARAEPFYRRALKIREKALGPDHPDTARSLNNLAGFFFDLGKKQEALEIARNGQQAGLKTLNNILSFTSEQQRLSYQATINPYSLFASIGSAPDNALAILHYKGVVLDSLLEDRLVAEASKDPVIKKVIDKRDSMKPRVMQLSLDVPKDVSDQALKNRAAEQERLSREVEQLEGALARHVAGVGRARRALSVTRPSQFEG